ncbi:DUF3613 domain-containing protein [Caballeronia sp. LP006]|uniref:DUF3613 domain-containing protein n=1 Tax=Caballeronia sp. LP006 TaxID=3038552 RepID=UPI0028659F42|nr:DUF3613 domain-containing protein [Caballeronia sp. LP006]MDR5827580.1 DUF3613 domain-containing protein [Caballeronia sp. LP006]
MKASSMAAIWLSAMALVSAARAEEGAPAASEVGHATEAWLTLQSSNAAAGPARPMPGAQASLAYARYMKSFETVIPERYGSSLEQAGRPALDVNYHDAD